MDNLHRKSCGNWGWSSRWLRSLTTNLVCDILMGESHPSWQFAHHAAHPLLGCQSVYAVLDAPGDAGGVRLSVELIATLETRFGGIIRVGLPEEARAHVSRVIPA